MPQSSIREVAARAGVSVGTVSNVLNRPGRVAQATRARVLAAIDELGFVRNEAARRLRSGSPRNPAIGLVVPDMTLSDLARGIADAGLALLLCDSGASPEREAYWLDLLEEQRVFGVLLSPVAADDDRIERLRRTGTAVVLLERQSTGENCSAYVDHVVGASIAISHLLEQGHRRIAFVEGPQKRGWSCELWQGAVQAVERAGFDPCVLLRISSASPPSAAREVLAALPRPTAVFCTDDVAALGVIHQLLRAGVQVPEDVAVVGYDAIEPAAAAAVPLTSVRLPRIELGRVAAELALEESADPVQHPHRSVRLAPELIVRQSSSGAA